MEAFSFLFRNRTYRVASTPPSDLSIPIVELGGPEAYHLPKPVITPFKTGDFVGSIAEGGNVNCALISFYPHGSGTHTESLWHVSNEGIAPYRIPIPVFIPAFVVTIDPKNGIIDTLPNIFWENHAKVAALIVRTLPNTEQKKSRIHSNTNPPYFCHQLMKKLAEHSLLHLLTDLPSVDPEIDGGKLLAHKAFFNNRKNATITELIYVPNTIEDGLYGLNLQFPAIETDAVPSRPLLHSLLENEL